MRFISNRLAATLRRESGLTSVEYALVVALILVVLVPVSYYLATGTKQTTESLNRKQSADTPPGTTLPPTSMKTLPPPEKFTPAETDNEPSPFWMFVLWMVVFGICTAAGFVVWMKAMEWAAQLNTLRRHRSSMSEGEVDHAMQKVANMSRDTVDLGQPPVVKEFDPSSAVADWLGPRDTSGDSRRPAMSHDEMMAAARIRFSQSPKEEFEAHLAKLREVAPPSNDSRSGQVEDLLRGD